jgi:hypothetical protein
MSESPGYLISVSFIITIHPVICPNYSGNFLGYTRFFSYANSHVDNFSVQSSKVVHFMGKGKPVTKFISKQANEAI